MSIYLYDGILFTYLPTWMNWSTYLMESIYLMESKYLSTYLSDRVPLSTYLIVLIYLSTYLMEPIFLSDEIYLPTYLTESICLPTYVTKSTYVSTYLMESIDLSDGNDGSIYWLIWCNWWTYLTEYIYLSDGIYLPIYLPIGQNRSNWQTLSNNLSDEVDHLPIYLMGRMDWSADLFDMIDGPMWCNISTYLAAYQT